MKEVLNIAGPAIDHASASHFQFMVVAHFRTFRLLMLSSYLARYFMSSRKGARI
jgi:hypothetical protein